MELTLSYVDQVLIFICFALSLNLLQGYAGQVSVAHAAFGAVGGYTLGYLVLNSHMGAGEAIVIGTLAWLHIGAEATLYAVQLNVVRAKRLWPRALFGEQNVAETAPGQPQ